MRIPFFISGEFPEIPLPLVILLDQLHDLKGALFKSQHIEIHLCTDLMLRGLILFAPICKCIVGRASVPRGDDNPMSRFSLQEVQQIQQDGIDSLPAMDQGKAMSIAAFAPKELQGNPRELRFNLPSIGRARGVCGRSNRRKHLNCIAMDVFALGIALANLFSLRALKTSTCREK